MSMSNRQKSKSRKDQENLENYWEEVTRIILTRQHPASGLIPASIAVTTHGDYRDAWVRDNVYSILAVWGLALAYRRLDDDQGRACKFCLNSLYDYFYMFSYKLFSR